MTENKDYMQVPPQNQEVEEQEIDLMEYATKLWSVRKLLIKVACIAAIVGVVIAFTTPRQYTVTVTLAPESSKSGSSSLSGIASMLGMGGFSMGSDADALHVMLYPDIVSSTPFILDLMDTPVKSIDEEIPDTTLTGYLTDYTKNSLLGNIISLPFKALSGVLTLILPIEEQKPDTINPFQLTKDQSRIVKGLKKMIVANVDKKTGITTLSVTMQDPMVAAIITDTVVTKLKEHITKYRTSKAEEDCKYWEHLHDQRQEEYYEKQKNYAEYADANKNVVLQSVLIEQERLQNEMNLALQVYGNIATQLQMARAKVQEAKPVFAVVEPATVPLKPSGRGRMMTVIGIIFLALAGTAAWILFGKDFLAKAKEKLKTPKENK